VQDADWKGLVLQGVKVVMDDVLLCLLLRPKVLYNCTKAGYLLSGVHGANTRRHDSQVGGSGNEFSPSILP
jgi:hypothetical protein